MRYISPEDLRNQIPFLNEYIYLDSNATTPVPQPVIDSMVEYFKFYGCNIERGSYSLSNIASEKWNESRAKIANLLLHCSPEELIFTRNLTQASNMVAYALENSLLNMHDKHFSFLDPLVKWNKDDEIAVTILEHHSNFMPWLRLAKRLDVTFKIIKPASKLGVLTPEIFKNEITNRTKLVALQHVSNSLGVIHDIRSIVKTIKDLNPECLVFIDGSQSVGHMEVDVKKIGCDFYGFSGHKGPLGPQGTGGLYVKKELIEKMEPEEVGGGIIADVNVLDYTLRDDYLSKRFDAGTPNIPGMIGLGRAAEYVVNEIGLTNIEKHEKHLVKILLDELSSISNIEIYGPTDLKFKSGCVSFNVKNWVANDVAFYLDRKWKILVRAGHHCTIPLMKWLNIFGKYGGTVRISFHYYNLESDISVLVNAIKHITRI